MKKAIENIKGFVKQGALSNQSGQDVIEYVAIGGLVFLVVLAVVAIIRATLISKAGEITW